MADIQAPDPLYEPAIPQDLIDEGILSDAQLEPIVYAGRAHSQLLNDENKEGVRYRRGHMVGDGTGVGKGRIAAGIILDNWMQGRRKAVWVSNDDRKLFDAARIDWQDLKQDKKQIFKQKGTKYGEKITAKKGILFTNYDTMKYEKGGEAGKGKPNRVDQIVDWLGKDFDGVIVFDEAHNMANVHGTGSSRGRGKPSAKALAGVLLQDLLPNARIEYLTATAATEVSNYAYAERLGLWGRGTAFPTKHNFIEEIASGGIAAMEIVARDMKGMGSYISRGLSFNDGTVEGTVTFDRLTHHLTGDQIAVYDKLAEGWRVVHNNMKDALEVTGGENNSRAKGFVESQFQSAQQRFFNQIITAMQTPAVINSIQRDLDNGNSAVIQLTNTMEAAQERAIAGLEKDQDLDDFDITPRDMLLQLVDRAFPTVQYETVLDENGNTISVPVEDSAGNMVINREAEAMKERLLDELGSIRVPESPMDMIINHFGIKQVAEVTGRSRRVVLKEQEDGSMKKVVEKRSKSASQADIAAFQSGRKRILIFSDAGGTGAGYHSSKKVKNQQRRIHYMLQPGWRADKAMQGVGRTHRTNQAWAPHYYLVETNLKGQKRFISTIARRFNQLGALTKGERKAGSTGLFTAADDLETTEARDALVGFYRRLVRGGIESVTLSDFEAFTGLRITTDQGTLKTDLPPMSKFMNRLLALEVDLQNSIFNELDEMIKDRVEQAIAQGTLDQGVETVRAERIEKKEERVVYVHPDSKAETRYVKVETQNRTRPVKWKHVKDVGRYVRSSKGNIYAVTKASDKTDATTGRVVGQYWLTGQTKASRRTIEAGKLDWGGSKWDAVDPADAKDEWVLAVENLPGMEKKNIHLITGAILPIWNRLTGSPRIYRLLTDDGEQLLGRVLPAKSVTKTLEVLGITADAPSVSAGDAIQRLIKGDIVVKLVNGWRLKRSRVQGESRIEIVGPDYAHHATLENMGVFRERIQYNTRLFIPTAEPEASQVYNDITQDFPVAEIEDRDEDPTTDAPSAQGGFVGGRPGKARTKISAIVKEDMKTTKAAELFLNRSKGFRPTKKRTNSLQWAVEFFKEFRFLPYIPKKAEFGNVREAFRHLLEVAKLSHSTAVEDMKYALKPVAGTSIEAKRRMEAVRRKLIADDLYEDMEKGVALPPGLKDADIEAMKEKSDYLYNKYPTVREAYDRIRAATQEITDMLVEEGWLNPEHAKEMYFPHKVIKYLRESDAFLGQARKPAEPRKSYLRQRKGGVDYSTDVLERLIEHWAQVRRDVETSRFLQTTLKSEQANYFKQEYPEWKQGDEVPAGYKEVTVLPGRFYYKANGVSEDMAMALMLQNLEMIETIMDEQNMKGKGTIRQMLAVGKKRAYIVREPVARQMLDLPTQAVSDLKAYKAVASFNTFVKRQILFNPLYVVPFNVTNFIGDGSKNFVALPSALGPKYMVN